MGESIHTTPGFLRFFFLPPKALTSGSAVLGALWESDKIMGLLNALKERVNHTNQARPKPKVRRDWKKNEVASYFILPPFYLYLHVHKHLRLHPFHLRLEVTALSYEICVYILIVLRYPDFPLTCKTLAFTLVSLRLLSCLVTNKALTC